MAATSLLWSSDVMGAVVHNPAPLPPAPKRDVTMEPRETLRILDAAGQPLFEVQATDSGPVLRLATSDTTFDLAGKLRLQADEIELIARDGDLRLLAKDDVIALGEKIRLN